jgi:phage tail tape-measure protein
MDSNKRFDQIESLLVDLARKVDQQGEQIAQIITVLNRQGEAISQQGEAINRQGEGINRQGEGINRLREIMEQRFGDVGEQIGDIINILKLSETRHTENAQQQAGMLTEIQRLGKRTDASVEAIKLLLKRQETTDTRLDGMVQTQLQMLQLQRLDADKIDELTRKLPAVEGQEPRIKRLEDEVFRAAS